MGDMVCFLINLVVPLGQPSASSWTGWEEDQRPWCWSLEHSAPEPQHVICPLPQQHPASCLALHHSLLAVVLPELLCKVGTAEVAVLRLSSRYRVIVTFGWVRSKRPWVLLKPCLPPLFSGRMHSCPDSMHLSSCPKPFYKTGFPLSLDAFALSPARCCVSSRRGSALPAVHLNAVCPPQSTCCCLLWAEVQQGWALEAWVRPGINV